MVLLGTEEAPVQQQKEFLEGPGMSVLLSAPGNAQESLPFA